MQKYLWTKAPELACLEELDLSRLLNCDGLRWQTFDYGVPFLLGNTVFVHRSAVSAHSAMSARKHVEKYGRSVVHGHTHRAGQYQVRTMNGLLTGTEVGCLARLDPEYMMPPANWAHAMAVAHVAASGKAHVQLLPIYSGDSPADGPYVLYGG